MRWRVLVRMERLELSWVSPPPPQDGVSASFTTSAIQEPNWRHNLEWIGGFELLHHVDNTQLTDSASGLKAQMPHNPASIVRLLYGEPTAKPKAAATCFLFQSNSLTPGAPIGRPSPRLFENAGISERNPHFLLEAGLLSQLAVPDLLPADEIASDQQKIATFKDTFLSPSMRIHVDAWRSCAVPLLIKSTIMRRVPTIYRGAPTILSRDLK
jgi:hypothetical protein